jgi:hypothetical protein
MNKTFFIAWVVIFVAWMAGSFVVHGTLLHDDYTKLSGLFRPEAEAKPYFPLMVLAHIILAGAFVWIYSQASRPRRGCRREYVLASRSPCLRSYQPT